MGRIALDYFFFNPTLLKPDKYQMKLVNPIKIIFFLIVYTSQICHQS